MRKTEELSEIVISDIEQHLNLSLLEKFHGQRVLITGASGLLGTYLIAAFVAAQRSLGVRCSIVATTASGLFEPLSSFCRELKATPFTVDLTSSGSLANVGKFDSIIHAACYGQPGKFMAEPVKTLKLNTSVVFELFSSLVANGSFLFISSSEVYSGLLNSPFTEEQIGTTNTNHPRACYIEAKRCGEAICKAYSEAGFKATSARLALGYGPGTKLGDKRVLHSFIERALKDRKLILMDMGEAKRTYCYVTDAIEMLLNIMHHGKYDIYNVGGRSRTTIADLANKIGEKIGVSVEFPNVSASLSSAPDDVFLSLNRYETEFGSKSFVSLDEGLSQTIRWQKALIENKLADKEYEIGI